MLHPPTKLLPLLLAAILPSTAVAAKNGSHTKTFKFKEDFFLEFRPLPTAIGPNESVDVLMDALDDIREKFRDAWIYGIENDLQDGDCVVERMPLPEFSMCDWKYPDRYDVDELPTAGQCYDYESGFIQRIYYEISDLEITCPKRFGYKDLEKDEWSESVFDDDDFLEIINPPNERCRGDATTTCLFSDAEVAEWTGWNQCTAELYINRFLDVPVYLKCLDTEGYGRNVANKLIDAMDKYFEEVIAVALEAEIYDQAPRGFVYSFASPYDSDRRYCAHGDYYAGGNLVGQVPDEDGVLITRFTYGFDVIWYKPKLFKDELLPNVEDVINDAFKDGDFLRFLKDEYPQYDFIQDDNCVCEVIDPGDGVLPTFPPTPYYTEAPPICNIYTNEGCNRRQTCALSCVKSTSMPECYDDVVERDCTDRYGDGYVCKDSNRDGIITKEDHSKGCVYRAPTFSPTLSPSLSPTSLITSVRTCEVGPNANPRKDCEWDEFCQLDSGVCNNRRGYNVGTCVEKPDRCNTSFDEVCGCDRNTYSSECAAHSMGVSVSHYGECDTAGTGKTQSPTPQLTIPSVTPWPTNDDYTPSPTCPFCIIHPDDTNPDRCPIITDGTCGDGDRGDGICPFVGYCCSKYGWCGTTPEYCEDDSQTPAPNPVIGAPPSPIFSRDAGQCAGGRIGDGFCPNEDHCCSEWGYCGEGENYCYDSRCPDDDNTGDGNDGTCGGGGVGNGRCGSGLCCSRFGFCGEGELYCTGQNAGYDDVAAKKGEQLIKASPLPDKLKPEFGYRCGITEVDARSNCKKQCTHHVQCQGGEECWGVQLNYCNTFQEGSHPICTDLDQADTDSRCGYDEASARGHCGPKCKNDAQCADGESCFPTMLNLCDCNEQTCGCAERFYAAKELISPYFVASEDEVENLAEGKPRSASIRLNSSSAMMLLSALASTIFLWM